MTTSIRPLPGPLWSAVAGLFCLLASVAAAQQPHAYDIRHYDLHIAPDLAARTIAISAAVDIDNPTLADTFAFSLGDAYQVTSAGASGAGARVQRTPGEITVTIAKPAKHVRLKLKLSAKPGQSEDESRPVMDDCSLFLLWSDRFYPADFNDWSTVNTTLVLPAGFHAIAPGWLVESHKRGDKVEFVFRTTRPTVSFSVFADSRWVRTEREMDGRRFVTLLHPESQKHAERIFATSPDVLKFFAELHGDYPFDQFAFVTLPGIYARRAFPGWVGYSPAYLDKEMARTGYDAHETSLLWWGLTTHGRGPGSWQWTEGLGDYVEAMYAEARHLPLAAIFSTFRNQYLDTPPDQDLLYTELRGNTPQKLVHGKYPWLMHVLRARLGDDAFSRGIRLLFARYRHQSFTMDEFIALFEEASGQSLAGWREQWLGRKGAPVVAFASSVEPQGNGYRVTCRLEQRGELYDLPLEIAIRTATRERREKILLRERKAQLVFTSAERPSEVVLDPDERILMKKIPAEPSPAAAKE